MNHYLLLRLARQGITIKEAAALVNSNYRAMRYHFQKAEGDGYIEKKEDKFFTTSVGLEELATLELPQSPFDLLSHNYQISVVNTLDYEAQQLLSTPRDEAVKWLMENMPTVERVVILSAIAADNLDQLNKIPRKE